MKSKTDIHKKHKPEDLAEAMVFPADKSQREGMLEDFRAIRKQLGSKQSAESKRKASLLQLKFIIEDYLQSSDLNKDYFFGYFLKEYISRLSAKNTEFARDIDVNPTELSQVIKRHRKPTDKLIYRLDIHSNRNFPATVWFHLLEKERACELYYNRTIIESEKKHVKRKLEFSL